MLENSVIVILFDIKGTIDRNKIIKYLYASTAYRINKYKVIYVPSIRIEIRIKTQLFFLLIIKLESLIKLRCIKIFNNTISSIYFMWIVYINEH